MDLHRCCHALRRVNRAVGLACGAVLVAACVMILVEIVLRRIAFGLIGGTDELSGYVMAAVASWSAAYALIERAHIRIDLVHRQLPGPGRTLLDLASLATLLAVSVIITVYGWRVLDKTLTSGATANTPLETPLWIPQTLWLAGWVWFAVSSAALLGLTCWALLRGARAVACQLAGPEGDETAETASQGGGA